MFTPPAAAPKRRLLQRVGEWTGVVFILLSLLSVALAFVLPRFADLNPQPSAWLDRLWVLRSGDARLEIIRDAQGQTHGWRSLNLAVLTPLYWATGDLNLDLSQAAFAHYARQGLSGATSLESLARELRQRNLRLFIQRERALSVAGTFSAHEDLYVRDAQGQFWIGRAFADGSPPLVFDPPILWLPLHQPTSGWSTVGQTYSGGTYTYTAQINRQTDTCVWVSWSLHVEASLPLRWAAVDQICDGAGVIAREEMDEPGNLRHRLEAAPRGMLPPPLPLTAVEGTLPPVAQWQLQLVGKANLSGAEIASTAPLVWVEASPPLLLAAALNGDLIAFTPHTQGLRVVWRFRTGGSVYSPPAVDPTTGRIYFGSTDKQIYALDARGLFLWSFATGDNIAAQPLLIDLHGDDRLLVVGGEDGFIYALDAAEGTLRWRRALGASVAAAAVAYRSSETTLVVVGNDNGDVVALDARTGEPVWTYAAPGAVVGALRAAQGQLFVAAQSGEVMALDAVNGTMRWQAETDTAIVHAPAIGQDLVAIVDSSGVLSVYDPTDGALRWRESSTYTAAPHVLFLPGIGETLLAVDRTGGLTLFAADGTVLGRWATSTLVAPQETANRYSFTYAPTLGGGALWAISDTTLIWRLGGME